MEENTLNLKPIRKNFSIIGFALCIYIAVTTLMQLALYYLPAYVWGKDNWYYNTTWGEWLSNFVPMYLFALPVFTLIMRKLPTQKPIDNKISFGKLIMYFLISYFLISAGNIIGIVSSFIFSGGKAENHIAEYAMDTNPIKVVVMVILAPIIEEFIFRKLMLDRISKYGEKMAIFFTAFAFGLLHQNLYQFFYAFGVGLIFGYIYVRTGRIRYSIILHAIINFMGSVIAPFMLKIIDIDKLTNISAEAAPEEVLNMVSEILPEFLIYILYSNILSGIIIAGLVLFIIQLRKLKWQHSELELPKDKVFKTAYLNVGVILYIVVCTVFTIIALF
jgi:membrane protease YdiL (CAAX protease family)